MLALAFVVLAAGALMVTSGVADPEGGPLGLLSELVKGKAPTLKTKSSGDVLEFAPALLDTSGSSGGGGGTSRTSTGTGAGAGGGIIGAARRELGKPYQWGGVGPDRWDCSGLVWHAVQVGTGMKWDRTTAEGQRRSSLGVTVPASSARPGDIVFFGIPANHCGINLGGGRMIAAPQTGDVVKESPINGIRTGPITYRRFPKPKAVTA